MDNYHINITWEGQTKREEKESGKDFYADNDTEAIYILVDYIADWLEHIVETETTFNFELVRLEYDRHIDLLYEGQPVRQITIHKGVTI